MLLYEYEALEIFKEYGIRTEPAVLARTPEEALKVAEKIPPPYMVKAQVRASGRGKAGGIKPAETPNEVKLVAEQLIGTEIKGETVKEVLVSHRVQVERELYISLLTDRYSRSIVAVASPHGGVDIEELARKNPSSILKIRIDPYIGVKPYHTLRIRKHLGVDNQVERIVRSMYNILVEYNAKLVEINPLVLTPEGLIAVDRRIIIDDSAIPFNPKLTRFAEARKAEKSQEELIAEEGRFSYVPLRGDIGIIGNGAGLTMATMDLVQQRGGRPGCFLDIGG
ncbi:MAG TPA: succinate--CoA ligase subunit beta, partial [Thermofilum sp.]|nr:succinate--CoA ligase subunit beta [Thermofilum sp.]